LTEKEEVNNLKICADESLCALKECKRAVEIRYKNVLIEISEQTAKLESLHHENSLLMNSNKALESRLNSLNSEKNEQTEIIAELQQNLILKSSEYENQIRNMQIELGNRLDEINDVQKEDVDKVKGHYRELFQEKASEVMVLREEAERLNKIIENYQTKVKDLEYREEELNNIVNKMREGKISNESSEILEHQLSESINSSKVLQERVLTIGEQFKLMKENNSIQLKQFDFHIHELKQVIRDKEFEIEILKKTQVSNPELDSKNTQLESKNAIVNEIPSHKNCLINSEQNNNSETINPQSKSKQKKKKKKSKINS